MRVLLAKLSLFLRLCAGTIFALICIPIMVAWSRGTEFLKLWWWDTSQELKTLRRAWEIFLTGDYDIQKYINGEANIRHDGYMED